MVTLGDDEVIGVLFLLHIKSVASGDTIHFETNIRR